MPRKVGGSDQLTGGTLDVNPQLLSFSGTQTTANTYKEDTIRVPLQRISPQRPNEAIIMEILKIFVNIPELDTTSPAEVFYAARLSISTSSQATLPTLGTSTCIFAIERQAHKAFTAGGTYETVYNDPAVFDMTDGAGHGILVGTDNIFVGYNTNAYTAVQTFTMKIMYRWKRVGLTEYIGIVQSQQ